MTNSTQTLWQTFMQTQNTQTPLKTQMKHAMQASILVDLSYRGLIKLSGEDVYSFLQGQVTNDVKLLANSKSQFAGYCNPKGRLLAIFFAFARQDAIYLSFNQGLIEPITKRLKMYVMRSKVLITEVKDLIKIGVSGVEAEKNLLRFFPEIPENAHDVIQLAETTLLRLPSPTPMFVIVTTQEKGVEIWQSISSSANLASNITWDWLEIQAGIPEIYPETQEDFVPQMANLDALGGINFKKGCYTGQEIVARTHYLGKVKRRTQLAHIDSEISPKVGDEITDLAQQVIGKILRVCPAINAGFDVLAECRSENLDEGVFWLNHKLSIKVLPYTL